MQLYNKILYQILYYMALVMELGSIGGAAGLCALLVELVRYGSHNEPTDCLCESFLSSDSAQIC